MTHSATLTDLGQFHPQSLVATVVNSASDRPLRRRDLRFSRTDAAKWNVLDPISRRSYRVGLVEHWLLTHPDGKQSVAGLLNKLRAEFPELTWSDDQLWQTVSLFRRNGLLSGSSTELVVAAPVVAESSGVWQAWLGSVVVWQIRGLRPDRWLGRLAPHTSGLFSGTAVRGWLAMALFTLLLVLLDFRRLSAHAWSLKWIMHPSTGGWLFFVFVVTRGLHELGHALVCKRFGVRCPDIGLFVILGAPCVYCDVSESWQLSRRWQRACVAAAGMYVELIVATLAAWVWLVTLPGAANTLALQTMLVCSLSTFVINANPLMRFDGYYILADWLDEVNLRGKADTLAGAWLQRLVLGGPRSQLAESAARYRFLLVFSVAGWVYRAMLSVTIATVLVSMYAGWNLPWLGRFLAAAILVSWWGVPAVKLSQELVRTARRKGRGWRLALVAALLTASVAILPIPNRRLASGWLQPVQSQGVYVGSLARLSGCAVRDGATVQAGQPLFELHSQALATRLVRYQQAHQVAAIGLEAGRRQRDRHSQDIDVEQLAHQLQETRGWLDGVQQEIDTLRLTAPISGRLVAMTTPPAVEPDQADMGRMSNQLTALSELGGGELGGGQRATWCDATQIGRFVPEGSLLACVCGDQTLAVIPLNEEQLASVTVGTPVRLRVSAQSLVLKDCQVTSVVRIDELASPWQAAALAALDWQATQFGNTPTAHFAAVIELPSHAVGLPGTTVDAVFVGRRATLAGLASRWLWANLRLLAD